MTHDNEPDAGRRQIRDLVVWIVLAAAGLGLTALAIAAGAKLGTASAPFLGRYRLELGPTTVLAPAVAVATLVAAARGVLGAIRWNAVLWMSYFTALAWALALAAADGFSGLTSSLDDPESTRADVARVDDPFGLIRGYVGLVDNGELGAETRGHPPGPLLLLWLLDKLGVQEQRLLGLLITAIGVLTVPLVLSAVRSVCGEEAARRYAPVLVLAPYAVWLAVSLDAVVATLGAAMVAAGARASHRTCTGWHSAGWAAVSGLLIGVGALFSYAAAWLGLSVVCLYFARRRPFLNWATGIGVLVPIAVAQVLGFGWVDGLLAAEADYGVRVDAHRSALVWSAVSIVALVIACGPPLVASLRKVRNTPGWPFLAGAGVAVVFSVLAGFASGGVEHAWLPFFPWLTVAAVAPERQGGRPVASPLLLVAGGAVTAIVVEAVLATPW